MADMQWVDLLKLCFFLRVFGPRWSRGPKHKERAGQYPAGLTKA